jgi:stage II sporulation protein AB (anti-sigma F factor)
MINIKTNVDENSAKLFRGIITNYLDVLDVDIDLCTENEVKAVLSEMISNVLVHAYPESDNKPITVTIDNKELDGQVKLIMTVTDEGIGMTDVKKCMEPMYTTCKDESRCGLGFTIMENMSDNLIVTSNPNFGTKVIAEKVLYSEE